MEMTYTGTMVMPYSFAVIDTEEMEYLDGGVYISSGNLVRAGKAVFVAAAFNPIGAVLWGLGIRKAYRMLCAGVAKIALKLGAVSKILGIVFGIMGFGAVASIGYTIIDALLQGRGIDIGIKRTRWGLPYGLSAEVR